VKSLVLLSVRKFKPSLIFADMALSGALLNGLHLGRPVGATTLSIMRHKITTLSVIINKT
jgi:hypothetical protein